MIGIPVAKILDSFGPMQKMRDAFVGRACGVKYSESIPGQPGKFVVFFWVSFSPGKNWASSVAIEHREMMLCKDADSIVRTLKLHCDKAVDDLIRLVKKETEGESQ